MKIFISIVFLFLAMACSKTSTVNTAVPNTNTVGQTKSALGLTFSKYVNCAPNDQFINNLQPYLKAAKEIKLPEDKCTLFPLSSTGPSIPSCEISNNNDLHMSLKSLSFDIGPLVTASIPDISLDDITAVSIEEVDTDDGIQVSADDQALVVPIIGLPNGTASRPIQRTETIYKIFAPKLCGLAKELSGKVFTPIQASTPADPSSPYYATTFGKFGVIPYEAPADLKGATYLDEIPHISVSRCACANNRGKMCQSKKGARCNVCYPELAECKNLFAPAFDIQSNTASSLDFMCGGVCLYLSGPFYKICLHPSEVEGNTCELTLEDDRNESPT